MARDRERCQERDRERERDTDGIPEQIESTDGLLEGASDLLRELFLLRSQDDRQVHLFAIPISHHFAINHRRFASLSMSIIGTDRVDLHIDPLSVDELLVEEGALSADLINLRIEFTAAIGDLSKEPLAPSTSAHRIVDINLSEERRRGERHREVSGEAQSVAHIVIVCINRLLNKRLVQLNSIQDNIFIVLLDHICRIWKLISLHRNIARDSDVIRL
jgi:hypothetical protein